MKERAITLFRAGFYIGTLFSFVITGMIFEFFPSVALLTFKFKGTTKLIVKDKVGGTPLWTRCWIVVELAWFSAVILPIMCVYAECFIVLCEIEWTPYSLKVEHVEIVIIL